MQLKLAVSIIRDRHIYDTIECYDSAMAIVYKNGQLSIKLDVDPEVVAMMAKVGAGTAAVAGLAGMAATGSTVAGAVGAVGATALVAEEVLQTESVEHITHRPPEVRDSFSLEQITRSDKHEDTSATLAETAKKEASPERAFTDYEKAILSFQHIMQQNGITIEEVEGVDGKLAYGCSSVAMARKQASAGTHIPT